MSVFSVLRNLYGQDVISDYIQLTNLFKEIDLYGNEEHIREQQMIEAFEEFENNTYYEDEYNDDNYYSYNSWFNVFCDDYDKALQELYPSDRELCILRIAREAGQKYICYDTCFRFFKEYGLNTNEQTIFWNEYNSHRNKLF